MLKKNLLLAIPLFLLIGCGEKSNSKQFEHAGGTFSYALMNVPNTYIVRNISDNYSIRVTSQIMEGLVSLNPKTLKPEPRLASEIKISDDGLQYTFKLQEDVFFHPHENLSKDRKFVAEDVIFTYELICTPNNGHKSIAYSTIFENAVVGAKEFFNGETESISGLKINDKNVVITLLKKDSKFLDKLSMVNTAILAKEVVNAGKEGDLIGTGPFLYNSTIKNDEENKIILTKNPNYYLQDKDGNALPYLDTIEFIVESKKLEQLTLFEEENIHLIEGLPTSRITNLLDGRMEDFSCTPPKLLLRRKPILATQYYNFNLLEDKFKDVKVRQAINYALDRNKIVTEILNNQAYGPGVYGIIPPAAFSGYDAKSVKSKSYSYNPELAQKLLAEAGYPNGEGFPSIELKFNFGEIHPAVAEEFAKQMNTNLNINVNITGLTFEDKEKAKNIGEGDIFRASWYADYYGAESFLQNAYGKSVPQDKNKPSIVNSARYQNPEFDRFFEAGRNSTNIIEQYKNFSEAEKIMMEDAPFIILWYEESIIVSYSKVRNLELNPLSYYNFTEVYFKPWTKEEYRERSSK